MGVQFVRSVSVTVGIEIDTNRQTVSRQREFDSLSDDGLDCILDFLVAVRESASDDDAHRSVGLSRQRLTEIEDQLANNWLTGDLLVVAVREAGLPELARVLAEGGAQPPPASGEPSRPDRDCVGDDDRTDTVDDVTSVTPFGAFDAHEEARRWPRPAREPEPPDPTRELPPAE